MIKKIINILFNNIWYKLGSVLLAIIVWGIVQGEEVVEYNRRIKVNISVANGFAVKGRPYRYIDATLRGPRVFLGEIANKPIEAKIYIPSNQVGNLEIPFEKEFIKDWDNRIKLTVRDSYVTVFVDEEITREVPVREVLQGAPAEGYFIEKVIIKPEKVKVRGIKSEVAKLDEVVTEPIDINRINQSTSFDVILVNSTLGPNAFSEERAKVTIQVGDSRVNKKFASIPIEYVGTEFAAQLRPKAVSIVIQGTPGILSFVEKNDFRAFVELTNLKPGHYERDVQVKIPAETVLIETNPKKISVELLKQKRKG